MQRQVSNEKLRALALIFAIGALAVSVAAMALNRSIPYRIGFNDYSRYLWANRLTLVSLILAPTAVVLATALRKKWLVGVAILSICLLLFIGFVHSGPNL